MTTYNEDEIAAEEERFGGKLPDDLRRRYLDGMPEVVVITAEDGERTYFNAWGPSTTDTDTKGREYPTAGMTKDTAGGPRRRRGSPAGRGAGRLGG